MTARVHNVLVASGRVGSAVSSDPGKPCSASRANPCGQVVGVDDQHVPAHVVPGHQLDRAGLAIEPDDPPPWRINFRIFRRIRASDAPVSNATPICSSLRPGGAMRRRRGVPLRLPISRRGQSGHARAQLDVDEFWRPVPGRLRRQGAVSPGPTALRVLSRQHATPRCPAVRRSPPVGFPNRPR